MKLTNNLRDVIGVVTVQIEGFFTERFINLCKINNIKIWDIRNIVKGIIRFKINIYDFKKLKKISKRTKCKMSIKGKKGLYFTYFKYRKRKLVFILLFLIVLFSILFSTFIWDIDVIGNEYLSKEQIKSSLRNSGVYIGKCKIGLDKKEVINELRSEELDLSWVGMDIEGTKVIVKVVEKTRPNENNIQKNVVGDIVAKKSGVITKIVAESGTSKYKQYDYVNEGNVLIEGTVYNKDMQVMEEVSAKGYAMVDNLYVFEKEYLYNDIKKEYNNKKRTTFGITINSKENMLNYLNKSKKYDITKSSKVFNAFGNTFSIDIYTCNEYDEISIKRTKEELYEICENEATNYLNNNILKQCENSKIVDVSKTITQIDGGIMVRYEYVVNEKIGEFIERRK